MNIHCVVVTYNRLSLLRENIGALKAQTYPIDLVHVIDNHSTDGTSQWLDETVGSDPRFSVVHLPKNIGGAGGFAEGMKRAVVGGCDFVWVMDDDTIPGSTALERLVTASKAVGHIGFVCSKVVWSDGSPHKMNIPAIDNPPVICSDNGAGAIRCTLCSFVSSMYSATAIRRVGLPIREFFIWMDDVEFTNRLTAKGFVGLYVPDSVVLHKTPDNVSSTLAVASPSSAWKFYHLARNHVYFTRQRKKNVLSFYLSVLNRYRLYMRWIRRRTDTDENKQKFRRAIRQGMKEGLTFRPTIEFIP